MIDELALPDGSHLEATLVDAGNPTVFVRARDFGLKGDEDMAALPDNTRHRLEWAREIAAVVMGLAPDIFAARRERPGTPRISLVSESRDDDCQINARIMTSSRSLHHAFTGTGAIALACACATEGTLPQQMAGAPVRGMPLSFSHASGKQNRGSGTGTLRRIRLEHQRSGDDPHRQAADARRSLHPAGVAGLRVKAAWASRTAAGALRGGHLLRRAHIAIRLFILGDIGRRIHALVQGEQSHPCSCTLSKVLPSRLNKSRRGMESTGNTPTVLRLRRLNKRITPPLSL